MKVFNIVNSVVVLQVLSFVAENERTNIKQRQAEGIAAAKMCGVQFGRPAGKLPDNFVVVYMQWKEGEISVSNAAMMCGTPRSTFYRRAVNYEKK